VKIREVTVNNRKSQLELTVRSGKPSLFPTQDHPPPDACGPDPEGIRRQELGSEAVTYVLESGAEGTVHIDTRLSTIKTRATSPSCSSTSSRSKRSEEWIARV